MDPASSQRMLSKGYAVRSPLTVCGRVELKRRRWRTPGGVEVVPADAVLDATGSLITAGIHELCCRVALDSGSFVRAAEVLLKVGNLRLSDESLRQVVQSEGKLVQRAGETEQLLLDFDATVCQACRPGGQPTTRVYLGCDGVKVPVITDAEKAKRLAKARQRRRALNRMPWSRGVRRPRLGRHRGADQSFKEFKIVTFYDQSRTHRLVSVTRKDHRHAARLMRKGASLLKLKQAEERAAIIDGASWIAHRIADSGVGIKQVCLDFYHLSENVHKARRELFGEESSQGVEWAGQVLHTVRHEGYESMWELLNQIRTRQRRRSHRQAMDRLMNYVAERREMIRYVEFEQKGWDIGSGPTESQCKATTRRIKGRGMRWNPINAEAMMSLEALYQSGAWDKWWSTRHCLTF